MANYPAATPTWDSIRDLSNPPITGEVAAIVSVLGSNPKGSYSSVKERIDKFDVTDPGQATPGLRTLSGTGSAVTAARSDHDHNITYLRTDAKDIAGGYVSLTGGKVSPGSMGTFLPGFSNDKLFLRGDNVWALPVAGNATPNGNSSGDLAGAFAAGPTVRGIRTREVDGTAPALGNVYQWTESTKKWVAVATGSHQYIISANDSPTEWKNRAVYRCTGTNDEIIINNALLTAASNGARYAEVILAPGTYNVNLSAHPDAAGHFSAIRLYSKTKLRSEGRHAAIIRLANDQNISMFGDSSHETSIISNLNITSTGDTDISIEGIIVDANASNNSVGFLSGINLRYAENVSLIGVVAKNTREDSLNPKGQVQVYRCRNITIQNCIANNDQFGQGSAGFLLTENTNVFISGSRAELTLRDGFFIQSCVNVDIHNCYAYFNYSDGFSISYCRDVNLNNCTSGAKSSLTDTTWFPANINLGNGVYGFHLVTNMNLNMNNIAAIANGKSGIALDDTADGAKGPGLTNQQFISNIVFDSNTEYGVDVLTATAGRTTKIGNIISSNNGLGDIQVVGLASSAFTNIFGSKVTSPTMPSSGGSIVNPYPFTITVYIHAPAGTSITLALDNVNNSIGTYSSINKVVRNAFGNNVNAKTSHNTYVILSPGSTLYMTYSGGTPLWSWWVKA